VPESRLRDWQGTDDITESAGFGEGRDLGGDVGNPHERSWRCGADDKQFSATGGRSYDVWA
jgi:hypothetical protein